MSTEVKFTLIENSYNFIKQSISQAIQAEENPEHWKYAILHLIMAIELVLKDLLRKDHEILIFKNIDNPKETVSLPFAANRLQKISKIKFELDDISTINLATEFRNQIVHYEFSFKVAEIKSIYAKLIGFLQSFLIKHYSKKLSEIIEKEIWQEAINIIEYANELESRAKQRILDEKIDTNLIIECRKCSNYTFIIQNEINTCYACGYEEEICQCVGCEEYFYCDELEALHDYSDEYYCEECRNRIRWERDEADWYYSNLDDYPGY